MASFNIRVYGVLLDEQKRLLVSDEFIRGSYITKLPGGGLEFGEGTRDCLKREFKEETGIEVTVGNHLYTTDFFQISAFNKKDQIISIYYFVHALDAVKIPVSDTPFNFAAHQVLSADAEHEVFRWVPWNQLQPNTLTLPIDQVVIRLLKTN